MNDIVPALDWPTIAEELLQWACDQTGIAWAWADQDAPQPTYPFGLIRVVSGPLKLGTDEIRWDGDETLNHFGVRELTLSFECLVDKDAGGSMADEYNAHSLLLMLQSSLRLQSTKERFQRANVAVREDDQPIQNLDENVADRWISRALVEFVFYTSTTLQETVGFFEAVEVSSEISRPDGSPAPVQLENEVLELSGE